MQQRKITLLPQTSSLEDLVKKARAFVQSAKAPATLKAYRSDWNHFESCCRRHQLSSLPSTPETVALYITDLASTHASATITRRLTSITKAHQASGLTLSPASTHHFCVGETLKGIRRTIGTAQHGKDPLLTDDIRRIVRMSRKDLLGLRDRALTLVGFAGAFRRSELARIEVTNLTFSARGVAIELVTSKTDQEKAGRKVGIPFGGKRETCAVLALRGWLKQARIRKGPVFRAVNRWGRLAPHGLNKDSIGRILKRAASRAGMKTDGVAGHSLRSGHVTQAAMNGVRELIIMRQTGHRTEKAMRRYIRAGDMFRENAAAGLGI
jgi:integrase